MAKELDIRGYLESKQGQPINRAVYWLMRQFVARSQAAPMNLEIVDTVGVKKIREPFVLLSNHTSRCDWEYIGMAMKGHPLNFMASDVEFHRAHMHGIFKICKVIPKKNFVSDYHCIKEVLQVVRKGGNVILFPEGKSSISGTNQPILMGTSKMLKKLGVPVYYTKITGGYMSNTQWNIANRPGKVIITVGKLFDPEQLKTLDLDEMDRQINAAIYNDDFEWNRTARVKFNGNETVADKLEEHLYWCPKCGKELTMKGSGNHFVCSECGNGVTINEYYDLIPDNAQCVVPKDMRVWYELQRRRIYRQIRDNKDFFIEEKVTLGHQPNDHYVDKTVTSEPCGEGIIRLDRSEFSYKGTRDGQPYEIHIPTINLPTMVMETDSHNFGGFYEGEYVEFTPSRPVVTKWIQAIEECHRLAGGKWQNTLPQQQWIYEDDKPTDKENYFLQ